MRVSAEGIQKPVPDSQLALETLTLAPGEEVESGSAQADTMLLTFLGAAEDPSGNASLLVAGERESWKASGGMAMLRATVGPEVDRHAALGPRKRNVSVGTAGSESATGKRSFEILFGPHNGSLRATLFVGHVPPGAAPWHYHLYDEIVWIWRGEGRFHTREGVEQFGPGAAFRIRPREVHIVENTSATDELVVVGLFTPAGSPSAAYLAEEPS